MIMFMNMMMINLISMLFLSHKNPLMQMMLILICAMLVMNLLWTMMSTSWFSYLLGLIFLGGVMVVFTYVCSLIPNEILFSKKMMTAPLSFVLLLIILYPLTNKNLISQNNYEHMSSGFFNKEFSVLCFIMMSYLLISLLLIVHLINLINGSLRSFKY